MSLGSNIVDRERSLPKILTRHRGLNFCINCTSLVCFAAIFLCNIETVPNAPKRKETHQNMRLGSNGMDRARPLWKFWQDIVAQTFTLIAPAFSCNSEMVPNAPERKETHQNMSWGSNGVDCERSLRKIMTRLCGTKFYINYTSLARFTPSFVQ